MPEQYPALHAYTHLPGGSDPLPLAGVTEIDSPDSSIIVTNPNGPIVDLVLNLLASWAYDTITVPAGGLPTQVLVDWNNNTGLGALDFTTANTPKFVNSGIVIITLRVETSDTFTAGTGIFADLQTPAPTATFPDLLQIVEFEEATAANPSPTIHASGGRFAASSQGLQLTLANNDTVDHSIFWKVDVQEIVGAGA